MENINEIYLTKMFKQVLINYKNQGIATFFKGTHNYVPVDPKSNIHAHDYYLYVKVFNDLVKEDNKLVEGFPIAINQLIKNDQIVDAYVAYEVLIAQMKLINNKCHSFKINKEQMIVWFKQISSIFMKHKDRLSTIQYGNSKMYENGLEGLIIDSSKQVDKAYGVKML